MEAKKGRRDFIRLTALGLGGITVASPDPQTGQAPAKKLHIVCLGAHPGDPEFGCGGTMAAFADAGHAVTFIYLTRGEAYDSNISYDSAAAIRTKEAEAACRILDAKPVFAGQVDGNTTLDKAAGEKITHLITSEEPDLLFTQWPLDSHPDHQVTGMLALRAWTASAKKFPLYFYEVNTGSETMVFTPTDYVDITAVRDRKMAAMYAHKSQSPKETYEGWFRTMEEFRGLEAGVKAAEGFIRVGPASPARLLIPGASPPTHT
jgi:LmbE family N-acetylglucosaminyl deacetylase